MGPGRYLRDLVERLLLPRLPCLIHRLTYRRAKSPHPRRAWPPEESATTTPCDKVMLDDLDRFDLVVKPEARANQ
jgi:phosphoketolase